MFTMKQINSASLSETVLNFYINLTTMALYINLKRNLLLVTEITEFQAIYRNKYNLKHNKIIFS
jgi:hypothetical protein